MTAKMSMGRAYSDDLRVRILEVNESGEDSCRVLARRFGLSWEYLRKLRRQQAVTGQNVRVAQSGAKQRDRGSQDAHALPGRAAARPDFGRIAGAHPHRQRRFDELGGWYICV